MAEIRLACDTTGVGLERSFEVIDPPRVGSLFVELDGSATTDRDISTGSIYLYTGAPEDKITHVGFIDSNEHVNPGSRIEDDADATALILHGFNRLKIAL